MHRRKSCMVGCEVARGVASKSLLKVRGGLCAKPATPPTPHCIRSSAKSIAVRKLQSPKNRRKILQWAAMRYAGLVPKVLTLLLSKKYYPH